MIGFFLSPLLFMGFALAYFLAWALFLPELKKRAEQHSYRFSTLRFIFVLQDKIGNIRFFSQLSLQWKRDITISLFSLLFIIAWDISAFVGFMLGIICFELWFWWQRERLATFPTADLNIGNTHLS